MYIGILNVLLACLCWGLIFVIPSFIKGFNPFEIALGRFFIYGVISFFGMVIWKRNLFSKHYLSLWKKAALFGFLSTIVCYVGMVFGIRYANSSITALIYAMSPITIAFFGNLLKREFSFTHFLYPSIFMLLGVILVNLSAFSTGIESISTYLIGIGAACLGLMAWTWFTVKNSFFLSSETQVSVKEWNLMMGSATFLIVLVMSLFLPWLTDKDLSFYLTFDQKLEMFFFASIILGIVSTWLAFLFWNIGSKKLPISMSGQLMIFEVIFGLVFIYSFEGRIPTSIECLGIISMLFGVFLGCKKLLYLKKTEA